MNRQLPSTLSKSGKDKNPFTQLLLGIASLLWLISAQAEYDILFDASGSMMGFSKEEASWKTFLNILEQYADRVFEFGDKEKFLRLEIDLNDVQLKHKRTFLGEALQNWLTASNNSNVLVIVTDNVADAGNATSMDSQTLFEETLRSRKSPFGYISLLIVSLPFKGKIYDPNDDANWSKYEGPRALSVYILAKRDSKVDFNQTQSMLLSSLERFTPTLIPVEPPISARQVSQPNIDVRPDENVPFYPNTKDIPISLGEEKELSYLVDVKIEGAFELHDVNVTATIFLNKIDHLTDQGIIHAKVTPSKATLYPNEIKGFKVTFIIEKFNFIDIGLKEQLNFALQDTLSIDGNIRVNFQANRNKIRLSDEILTNWNYSGNTEQLSKPEERIQNRIFRLESVVKDLVPDMMPVQTLSETPVTLKLRYPIGPLISLLLLFLILILVGYLLWRYIFSGYYILESEAEEPISLPMNFGQTYAHYGAWQDQLLFKIRFVGIGFWVSSPLIIKGSKWINAGQGFRLHDPEAGEEYSWFLRRVESGASSDESDMYDW